VIIPVVLSEASLRAPDELLKRLLQDTSYIVVQPKGGDPVTIESFAALLAAARSRHRRKIAARVIPMLGAMLLISAGALWGSGKKVRT
jgi:hypothetical protein